MRRRRWARRALVALVVPALLTMALGGCSSSSDHQDADQGIAAAAAQASADKGAAEFTLRLGAAGQTIKADGAFRFTPGDPAMRLDMTGLPGAAQLTLVLVGDELYVKLPPGQRPVPEKPWLHVAAAGTDPVAQQLSPMLERLRHSIDPATNLSVLQGATTVRRVATAAVDGVSTTEYAFGLDVATALETATGAARTSLQELANQQVRRVDYTLWIDADDLPRKFEMTQDTAAGPVTASGSYRRWGEAVAIAPPPPDQVIAAAPAGSTG